MYDTTAAINRLICVFDQCVFGAAARKGTQVMTNDRALVKHLQSRPDAQNIDLMNLAGFCRNCLSKWYMKAAIEKGVEVDTDAFDAARR